MARSTAVVELTEDDRATLQRWSRSSSVRAGLAMRARIVLAVADGEGPAAISARLEVSRPTVTQWRGRFLASGLEGLNDAPRSGRPKTVDDAAILAATLEPPPAKLGVTHWSTRLLVGELGVGVGATEPQPRLLDGVVSLVARPQHPERDRPEVLPVGLEALGEQVTRSLKVTSSGSLSSYYRSIRNREAPAPSSN